MQAFRYKTVWEASKISLSTEKPCFISSPMKLMIDLGASKMTPMLQSIYNMPSEKRHLWILCTLSSCVLRTSVWM